MLLPLHSADYVRRADNCRGCPKPKYSEAFSRLVKVFHMTAVIYKLRDYQNPKDIERMQRELEKEAAAILVPFVETTGFTAPDKDSA